MYTPSNWKGHSHGSVQHSPSPLPSPYCRFQSPLPSSSLSPAFPSPSLLFLLTSPYSPPFLHPPPDLKSCWSESKLELETKKGEKSLNSLQMVLSEEGHVMDQRLQQGVEFAGVEALARVIWEDRLLSESGVLGLVMVRSGGFKTWRGCCNKGKDVIIGEVRNMTLGYWNDHLYDEIIIVCVHMCVKEREGKRVRGEREREKYKIIKE